ncbi:unnamed protein product, partial [Prorocentrum cordatum]
MPDPFTLRQKPPYQSTMQIFAAKKSDGNRDILKNVGGRSGQTCAFRCVAELVRGDGIQFRIGRFAALRALEKLEGDELRRHAVENRVEGRENLRDGHGERYGLTAWAPTLRDVDPCFLSSVLGSIAVSNARGFGLAWSGRARVGQSAGYKTLAFMMGRVEIEALGQRGEAKAGELALAIATA